MRRVWRNKYAIYFFWDVYWLITIVTQVLEGDAYQSEGSVDWVVYTKCANQITFFIVSHWMSFKKRTQFVHVHVGWERVVILEMCWKMCIRAGNSYSTASADFRKCCYLFHDVSFCLLVRYVQCVVLNSLYFSNYYWYAFWYIFGLLDPPDQHLWIYSGL